MSVNSANIRGVKESVSTWPSPISMLARPRAVRISGSPAASFSSSFSYGKFSAGTSRAM